MKKMAVKGHILLIINLYVNGVNAPNQRYRQDEWIQKQDPYAMLSAKTHFRPRDTYRLKVRGWNMIFHANRIQKEIKLAILILDKTHSKYY